MLINFLSSAATCPPPLIHNDCFRRTCERSCNSFMEVNPCPIATGVCFSGCFCPEGLVRKGDSCIPHTECRDCKQFNFKLTYLWCCFIVN